MMISDGQKKELQTMFEALPPLIKGHCMRTGIYMRMLCDCLMTSSPELFEGGGNLKGTDVSVCAFEFGFYHHLTDTYTSGGKMIDAESRDARTVIAPVFSGALNANGIYINGLVDAVETRGEHWDGSGPRGLTGKKIPFWGRVCAIAERYDDLTTPPHAVSKRRAMQQLEGQAGKDLDPKLVSEFARCMKLQKQFQP